jgi:hypothetical protein
MVLVGFVRFYSVYNNIPWIQCEVEFLIEVRTRECALYR